MGQCVNCGSQTVFDIKSQQLVCISCSSAFPVPQDQPSPDGGFNINTFSCPQCGAILDTTDTSMAEFCSYCGASVVLSGYSSRKARPRMVAPFQVTKDGVRTSFKQKMSKVKFLAREFKDDKSIESMRGIYIPYWSYTTTPASAAIGYYDTHHTEGDYDVTNNYREDFDVVGSYDGILYDASAAFADDLSEGLKPFNIKWAVPFQTGYLSGFYADSPDVGHDTYYSDVVETAKSFLKEDMDSSSSHDYKKVDSSISINAAQSIMLPVWFLTYRRNNRVAYMVANGQTGKIMADLPVDYKSAFTTAGIISLVTYLILLLAPAFHAKLLMILCSFMMLPIAMLNIGQIRHVNPIQAARQKVRCLQGLSWGTLVCTVLGFQYMVVNLNISGRETFGIAQEAFVAIIGILLSAIQACKARGNGKDVPFYLLLGSVPVICILVALVNPVSDMIYYLFAFLVCIIVLVCLVFMIKNYELLATRETPHFQRRGGDNRAY